MIPWTMLDNFDLVAIFILLRMLHPRHGRSSILGRSTSDVFHLQDGVTPRREEVVMDEEAKARKFDTVYNMHG